MENMFSEMINKKEEQTRGFFFSFLFLYTRKDGSAKTFFSLCKFPTPASSICVLAQGADNLGRLKSNTGENRMCIAV